MTTDWIKSSNPADRFGHGETRKDGDVCAGSGAGRCFSYSDCTEYGTGSFVGDGTLYGDGDGYGHDSSLIIG